MALHAGPLQVQLQQGRSDDCLHCRSFRLEYFKDVSVNGISTNHYEVPQSGFTMENPENLCYCHNVAQCAVAVEGEDRWNISQCSLCKDGLFNTQGCQGAPGRAQSALLTELTDNYSFRQWASLSLRRSVPG